MPRSRGSGVPAAPRRPLHNASEVSGPRAQEAIEFTANQGGRGMGDFMKSRLGMKAGVMAASFALLGGAIYAAEQPTLAQATSRPNHLRSMKRHSTMTPQKALKKISWAAAPIDQNKWSTYASGSLTANTAKLKSDCSDTSYGVFKYLVLSYEFGYRAKSCSIGLPPWTPDISFAMFKKPLAKLGNSFLRSVGLDYLQVTKKVAGNLSKVTATFKCSSGASPSGRGVKTIVVRRGGRATISNCPTATTAQAETSSSSSKSAVSAEASVRESYKLEVVCLNYKAQAFFYGARPHTCDYYDARAPESPITTLALVITRKVHWYHWGSSTALGRGQYHPKGAGYWTPMKIKLSRPANACGRRVFTSVQVKLKFRGRPWPKSWGARTPIKRCVGS